MHPTWLFNCRCKQDLWPGKKTLGPGGRAADAAGSWLEVAEQARRCRREEQPVGAAKVKQQLGPQTHPRKRKGKSQRAILSSFIIAISSSAALPHLDTGRAGKRSSEGGREEARRSLSPFSAASPRQDPGGGPGPSRPLVACNLLLRHTAPYCVFLCAGGAGRVCFAPRRGDVSQRRIGSVYSPPRIQPCECVYGGN